LDIYIFLIFELIFFFIIKNYFTIMFFHHFPQKIKFSIKEKTRAPLIRSRELMKIIKSSNFDYIGIRKETIFKVFSLKYFLYKNDKNQYLDITNNKKFYYISFYRFNILNLFYKKTLQVSALENDKIKIGFLSKGHYDFEEGDDVTRESIGQNFYKNNASLLSLSVRLPVYLLLIGYFIQLIWVIFKWVI